VLLGLKKIKAVPTSAGKNRAEIESYSAKMKTEQQITGLRLVNEEKMEAGEEIATRARRIERETGRARRGTQIPIAGHCLTGEKCSD
jgi:BMFP domain-containing protein YqiC